MGLRYPAALLTLSMVLAAWGCGENEFQPPPPPTVTVAPPAQRSVIEYAEFTGDTRVATSVDVRAQVAGILRQVHYESGAFVEQGDPLFVIDQASFIAARDALQARVDQAEAELRLAQAKAERIERSARDGALTEVQALEARAEADAAVAALTVAQRELAIKQLDVDRTEIDAPIAGLVDRSPYSVGDLVSTIGDASLMTTIYDDSRINVYFAVPDRLYLTAVRRRDDPSAPPVVEIGTEVDEGFPFDGTIDFADPTVDIETGTIQVRAVVDNPERELVGGLFVRIRFAVQTLKNALLVPQSAIGADQVGSYVLAVDADGVVERRDIELGPVDGDDRVVLSGLSADDRVVIRGLLQARPGSTVNPQPVGP